MYKTCMCKLYEQKKVEIFVQGFLNLWNLYRRPNLYFVYSSEFLELHSRRPREFASGKGGINKMQCCGYGLRLGARQ